MPRKVLVADDSVTIQKVVGITFAAEDVTLSFVDNGEEAIEIARQMKPDLIIADVLMPRKSGYEVCEAIKADPELSHVPVLLLTGTFEPFDLERSRRVGADGTITKPFESQSLIRQVNELLDRAAARAQAPPVVAAKIPTAQAPPPRRAVPAGSPAGDEAESAFADLSRDLELEPLPAAAESEPGVAPIAGAVPSPGDDDEVFDFGSEGDFSTAGDAGRALEADPAGSPGASPRLSEREDEFEFVEDPSEILELGEPVPVSRPQQEPPAHIERPFGATDPTEPDVFVQAQATEAGEVWDLSDLEAVEESAVIEAGEPQEESASPTFWDDAAAEAIDLVESVSADAPEELLLVEDEALDAETPAREESLLDAPVTGLERFDDEGVLELSGEEPGALEDESAHYPLEAADTLEESPDRLMENADLDLPLTGIDEAADPPAGTSRREGETLHPSLEGLPEFDFDAAETGEPQEGTPPIEAPVEPLSPVPFVMDTFFAESLDEEPVAPLSASPVTAQSPSAAKADFRNEAPTTIAAVADLGAETVNDVVRRAVNDAVERVTWEAFSDLSETVVKAVKEKVEQIAWEVIPQMAEAMIKEEIKRISEEKK